MNRRGKHQHTWAEVHGNKIKLWNERENSIQVAPEVDDEDEARAQYMAWYARITRRLISPPMSAPTGVYQPVAPDYHMMGNFVMDASGRATQTAQEAHTFYEQHLHNSMMGRVDEYCNYMTSQGSQLLNQVSFDLIQAHMPTGPRMQRPSQPDMPPSGSGVASRPGTQTLSSMVVPSDPSYGTVGVTPPLMTEPSGDDCVSRPLQPLW